MSRQSQSEIMGGMSKRNVIKASEKSTDFYLIYSLLLT